MIYENSLMIFVRLVLKEGLKFEGGEEEPGCESRSGVKDERAVQVRYHG